MMGEKKNKQGERVKEKESGEEERFTSALVRKLLARLSHFKFGSWLIHISFFNCMLDKSTDVTYIRKKKKQAGKQKKGERERERKRASDRGSLHGYSRVIPSVLKPSPEWSNLETVVAKTCCTGKSKIQMKALITRKAGL